MCYMQSAKKTITSQKLKVIQCFAAAVKTDRIIINSYYIVYILFCNVGKYMCTLHSPSTLLKERSEKDQNSNEAVRRQRRRRNAERF